MALIKHKFTQATIDSFHAKYKKEENGCWEWQAATQKPGPKNYYLPYGFFNVRYENDDGSTSAEMMMAHRVSYMMHNPPFEKSLQVRHMCHNPRCCNPEHLLIGTHQQNMMDKTMHAISKGTASEGQLIKAGLFVKVPALYNRARAMKVKAWRAEQRRLKLANKPPDGDK